jgi:hypothetical protein
MHAAVEQSLRIFALMRSPEVAEQGREKLAAYIDTLVSAGEKDAERLTVFGLTYLREMVERNPRFSGL